MRMPEQQDLTPRELEDQEFREQGVQDPTKRRLLIFLSEGVVLGTILAACGPDGKPSSPTAEPSPSATAEPSIEGFPDLPFPNKSLLLEAKNPYAGAFGLNPEAIEISYGQFTDFKGTPFVVGLDSATRIPLVITEKDQNAKWNTWKEATLRNIGQKSDILMGAFAGGNNMGPGDFENIQRVLNREYGMVGIYAGSSSLRSPDGSFDFTTLRGLLRLAKQNGKRVLIHPLIWFSDIPNSWRNLSADELMLRGKETIQAVLTEVKNANLTEPPIVVVTNEVGAKNDIFFQKKGIGYVDEFFGEARRILPEARLIINDYDNHTFTHGVFGNNYKMTKDVADRLSSRNLIDGVGIEAYTEASNLPPLDQIPAALKSYGLPVYITEFAVNIRNLLGTRGERFMKQADIYENVTKAIVSSGACKGFVDFQLGDRFSVHQNDPKFPTYAKNAEPTPYQDDLTPKPALYTQRRALLPTA